MAAKATGKKSTKAKATAKADVSKDVAEEAAEKKPVEKKLWPFFILEVLRKHAHDGVEKDDEGNEYLTRKQIRNYLLEDYGILTQEKAVGENLLRLYEAGYEYPELNFALEYLEGERSVAGATSAKGKKQTLHRGWRIVSNSEFEPSEVRMLIDTVIASSLIPQHQAEMLIGKLRPLSTEKIVVPRTHRDGHKPVKSDAYFLNIEVIEEAIREHKRVKFKLGLFGKDGRVHLNRKGRKGRTHNVVPMQLLISKGHYYLLGHYENSDEVYKYRVDLMQEAEVVEDSHVDAAESRINVVEFREKHAYMMSGKPVKVTLRIDKERLHTFFDQFGTARCFKNEREDTIDVEFTSALYSVLFWALQYYRSVEVLSPPELRQVLADAGSTIHKMYAGEPGTVSLADKQSNDELINGK